MELTEKEIENYKRCANLVHRAALLLLKSTPFLIDMKVGEMYFIDEADRYMEGLKKISNMLAEMNLETTGFPENCSDDIIQYVEEVNNFLNRLLLFKDICMN